MNKSIIASDFLQDTLHAFETIIRLGALIVESSTYDEQSFGNAEIILTSSHFRLRLFRDRDQVTIELACVDRPNDWSPLQRWLRVILGNTAPSEGIVTINEAALLVEQHFNSLQNVCLPNNIKAARIKLVEFEKQALENFIGS